MAERVKRFEDLIAWQKSRVFAHEVYKLTRLGKLREDRALANQLTRAARSVMANIAEGFERTGPREFHRALSTSKGSCAEVRSDLYLLLDVGHIDQATFSRLCENAEEISRILTGLMAAIAKSFPTRR